MFRAWLLRVWPQQQHLRAGEGCALPGPLGWRVRTCILTRSQGSLEAQEALVSHMGAWAQSHSRGPVSGIQKVSNRRKFLSAWQKRSLSKAPPASQACCHARNAENPEPWAGTDRWTGRWRERGGASSGPWKASVPSISKGFWARLGRGLDGTEQTPHEADGLLTGPCLPPAGASSGAEVASFLHPVTSLQGWGRGMLMAEVCLAAPTPWAPRPLVPRTFYSLMCSPA